MTARDHFIPRDEPVVAVGAMPVDIASLDGEDRVSRGHIELQLGKARSFSSTSLGDRDAQHDLIAVG